MICYKLTLSTSTDRGRSFASWGKYDAVYQIGETTYPVKGTKLFVFKHLKDLKRFTELSGSVFKCEAKNPRKLGAIASGMHPEFIDLFWEKFHEMRKKKKNISLLIGRDYTVKAAPKGTYSCDSVKLLKKIR